MLLCSAPAFCSNMFSFFQLGRRYLYVCAYGCRCAWCRLFSRNHDAILGRQLAPLAVHTHTHRHTVCLPIFMSDDEYNTSLVENMKLGKYCAQIIPGQSTQNGISRFTVPNLFDSVMPMIILLLSTLFSI